MKGVPALLVGLELPSEVEIWLVDILLLVQAVRCSLPDI